MNILALGIIPSLITLLSNYASNVKKTDLPSGFAGFEIKE